ncbi:MAG: flagellar basal body rod protein FlgB [Planctomycetota bacterium]|nr:flagellar basal body rod protein FlgB [Planctomycetota bacterium]
MLNGLLQSTTVPLLEKAAAFGERRHEVLVGNLANVETPGYRTKDLPVEDFERALSDAVALRHQQQKPSDLGLTSAGHAQAIDDLFGSDLYHASTNSPKNVTFQDGGNRSIEHEITEMTKNVMRQRMAIDVMNAQMEMLQMVISERPI